MILVANKDFQLFHPGGQKQTKIHEKMEILDFHQNDQ